MNYRASGFVVDGFQRFFSSPEFRAKLVTIEAHVRAEHAAELAAASSYWRRLAIEKEIQRKIRQRLDSITPSPYSLWSSQ